MALPPTSAVSEWGLGPGIFVGEDWLGTSDVGTTPSSGTTTACCDEEMLCCTSPAGSLRGKAVMISFGLCKPDTSANSESIPPTVPLAEVSG